MAILSGMQIVECGAFIAGPFSTMSLGELGAEVIRIDPIKGGIDYRRWPITACGQSLYWTGLNKGKKSVAIDTASPEGRELAQAIITAPGEDRGLFISNFPATGWLDYQALKDRRGDLIMVNIVGSRDGSTALDYTVNCAMGFPDATGPADSDAPVNHVFPSWDFICGQTAATALLAAERYRRLRGVGQHVRIALADVALAIVADMGFVAEVQINGEGRKRHGNYIYGAFGRDFKTSDERRLMVAAVSGGQWKSLCQATGIEEAVARLETEIGADFKMDTDRFEAREAIAALLEPWFAAHSLGDARNALNAYGACWGPYQNFDQLVAEDPRCSEQSDLFANVDHPGIGVTLTPRTPVDFSACDPVPPQAGPLLGEHTHEVLYSVLGLHSGAIGALVDRGIIAGPAR